MGRNCKAGQALLVETNKGKVYGEAGLMLVQWIGDSPRQVYGDVTGYPYSFQWQRKQFVDERDGVYLLGGLVELV
jgi:hypothetical protein